MFGMRLNRTADSEKVKLCAEAIAESNNYSLVKFMKENNLLHNSKDIGRSILLECPFHIDYSPSMSVDKEKNIYKCFSCGSSGGYFKFIIEFNEKVKRQDTNYYSVLDNILKNDPDLQLKLGFNTIYKNINIVESMEDRNRKFSSKTVDLSPNNYIELANILKKDSTKGESDYILMISLMQSGVDAKFIYKELYKVDPNLTNDNASTLDKEDYDFSKYFID